MKKIITSIAALLLVSSLSFANAEVSNESKLASENVALQVKLDEMASENDNLTNMLNYTSMMSTTILNLNEAMIAQNNADNALKLSYASMMSTTIMNLNDLVIAANDEANAAKLSFAGMMTTTLENLNTETKSSDYILFQ